MPSVRGSFEIAAFIIGHVRPGGGRDDNNNNVNVALDVHGILVNMAALLYVFPYSIAQSTAILAGAQLGADRPAEAVNVIILGVITVSLFGCLLSLGTYVLGDYWVALYSSDPSVSALFATSLFAFCLYLVTDNVKCATVTILRNTGQPGVTVVGNAVSCVLFILPMGWVVAVTWGHGLVGEWLVMCTGWLFCSIIYTVVLCRTDWTYQALQAKRRNEFISVSEEDDLTS